jgi:hypothetical protein
MADFDDDRNILKVNFKEKRSKPSVKHQRGDVLQTKAAGIVVAVLLIATIVALNVAFPTP